MTQVSRLLFPLLAWLYAGCAGLGYTGAASNLSSDAFEQQRGWVAVRGVPLYRQHASHDCGPTALAMVLRYWNPKARVNDLLRPTSDGRLSTLELRKLAYDAGFSAFVIEGSVEDLVHEISTGRPVIVGVAKPTLEGRVSHYEVVIGLHPESKRIATLDPAQGWRQNTYSGFLDEWIATGRVLIVVLPPLKTGGASQHAHAPPLAVSPTLTENQN